MELIVIIIAQDLFYGGCNAHIDFLDKRPLYLPSPRLLSYSWISFSL
jgi:hypothetical protein